MKKRYLSDIKIEGESLVKFIHSDELFTCSCHSALTEAVEYYEGYIYLHANNDSNSSESYIATEEDFQELKKVMLTSPEFVPCGENYIFSLSNVVSFEKGSKNILTVDCRRNAYNVTLNNKEEAKQFLMAIQRKWKRTFTEWDQNRDSSEIEEDTLSR